jgi:hypothetical protein
MNGPRCASKHGAETGGWILRQRFETGEGLILLPSVRVSNLTHFEALIMNQNDTSTLAKRNGLPRTQTARILLRPQEPTGTAIRLKIVKHPEH